MNILTLDSFYKKINNIILLLCSHLENKNLEFIIKSCRLRPIDSTKFEVHSRWQDEYGNFLLAKKGRLKIIYNDLILHEKNDNICTDFYHNLTLDKIVKMSKFLYLRFCKDEDYEVCLIGLLGIDNYFRVYLYDGEIINISPLCLGVHTLELINEKLNIKQFIEIKKKCPNHFLPFEPYESYLSVLPANRLFIDLIKEKNEKIYNILRF